MRVCKYRAHQGKIFAIFGAPSANGVCSFLGKKNLFRDAKLWTYTTNNIGYSIIIPLVLLSKWRFKSDLSSGSCDSDLHLRHTNQE